MLFAIIPWLILGYMHWTTGLKDKTSRAHWVSPLIEHSDLQAHLNIMDTA